MLLRSRSERLSRLGACYSFNLPSVQSINNLFKVPMTSSLQEIQRLILYKDPLSLRTCFLSSKQEPLPTSEDFRKELTDRMNNDPALQQMLQQRTQLPVAGYKNALVQAIRENQVVIVRGATGCGKTTQVGWGLWVSFLLLLFKLIYMHGDLSVPWFSKSRATTKMQYIIKLPNKYYLH